MPMADSPNTPDAAPSHVAAVDLGSNSFHMVVVRIDHGELKVVDRLRESVRLAAGLTADKTLTAEAQARALACLERFGQRLRNFPARRVRAVGTNTLRMARGGRDFLNAAGAALGHEIEVVSGYEEARLIYLGVAHSLADDGRRRLVVDIGGGSTELIVGNGFEPQMMESLHMGCVSLTQAHFADGEITARRLVQAELDARVELEPVEQGFRAAGWRRAVGASGTIRAIELVLRENAWSELGVTPAGLKRLRKAMLDAGRLDRLDLPGLSARRAQVLPGGFAVLAAIFEALGIERMEAADGALREGVIYDLIGRRGGEDVRERSVTALASRYHVDEAHARRVAATAADLYRQARGGWILDLDWSERMLRWAALLHETGLDISHSQYHKHGGYVLTHTDLAGFSREEQRLLALLVRTHRRKFPLTLFAELPDEWTEPAARLAVLLRLAVVLHRGRGATSMPELRLAVEGRALRLHFPDRWLEAHPLVRADLEQERSYLAAAGYRLEIA
jgi:exopolyphosphatase/guanosine-5'-triphosphate,3'-diphosphate pyrophosphatase